MLIKFDFSHVLTVNKMSDKLYFYSKSKVCEPGKGVNEQVNDPEKYKNLKPYFRRILSNFHEYTFAYNDYYYNTIEHAFQACKIALVDSDKAFMFTIDSGSDLGRSDGVVAQQNRKLAILDKDQIKIWDQTKDNIMKEIAIAKYAACQEARETLLATQDAELWHIQMRKKPVRFVHLEEIRIELCKSGNN